MKIQKSSYIIACVANLAGAPILIFKEKYQLIYDLAQEDIAAPIFMRIFGILSPKVWLVLVLFFSLLFIIKDLTSFAKLLNVISIVVLVLLFNLFMLMLLIPISAI